MREDAHLASRISAYWDTWSWIQVREGELQEAGKHVQSAWMIRTASVISDHLGRIYEQEGRKADALRMYKMAIAADVEATETRERLLELAGPENNIDALIAEGHARLKETRALEVRTPMKRRDSASSGFCRSLHRRRAVGNLSPATTIEALRKRFGNYPVSRLISRGDGNETFATGKALVHAQPLRLQVAHDFISECPDRRVGTADSFRGG